jgi:tripartite-type tricarboxylate transporter receptor subunit TctC
MMNSRRGKWRSMITILVLLGLGSLLCPVEEAFTAAEDYPNKPIFVNVGFAPGGASGNSAQIFADGAKSYLPKPQTILVNYKPGAATAVAADYVLKQPADGYNLYWFAMDLCAKLAKDGNQLSFKLDDFIQIGTFVFTPYVVPYNKEKGKAKTLLDFIAYAKKNPGDLSYGSSGLGTSTHVTAEIFQMKCGVNLNQIPFDGAAPAMTALMGGHVDTMFTTPGSIISQTRPGGALGVLGVMSAKRWTELPDVPKFFEKGIDIDRTYWLALDAPKGTPPAVVKILQDVLKKTAEDPKVKANVERLGYAIANWNSETTNKKVKEEFELSKDVFKKAGL